MRRAGRRGRLHGSWARDPIFSPKAFSTNPFGRVEWPAGALASGRGGPELLQDELGQREVPVELLDDTFAAGTAVVVPPHRQRIVWGVGHQCLEQVAGNLQQLLATSPFLLLDLMSHHHEAPRTLSFRSGDMSLATTM